MHNGNFNHVYNFVKRTKQNQIKMNRKGKLVKIFAQILKGDFQGEEG